MAARAAMWGAHMQDTPKCAACRWPQELRPCRQAGAVVSTKVGYWAGEKLALFVVEVVRLAVTAPVLWRSPHISLVAAEKPVNLADARLSSAELRGDFGASIGTLHQKMHAAQNRITTGGSSTTAIKNVANRYVKGCWWSAMWFCYNLHILRYKFINGHELINGRTR